MKVQESSGEDLKGPTDEDARLELALQELLRRLRDKASDGKSQVKVVIKDFIEKSDI